MKAKTATIVGAGLVGSLWALFLSKAGFKVRVFERRPDIRKADISAGKSINLALSDRGWRALEIVGVADRVRKMAIPMYGRIMHDLQGNLSYQPYGQDGQAIYSISRGGLNALMMDLAEEEGEVSIFYNERCYDVDALRGICYFINQTSGEHSEIKSDLIFGADGAFSAVRYAELQKQSGFNYSQHYIEDGYREILLPANSDGSHKLEKNALHIWPRGRFMLIALPNEDGSFTCTLFMPHRGEQSFEQLSDTEAVNSFFEKTFPDFYELMPEVGAHWSNHPLSSLALIRCYPWSFHRVALMGDAAHATVPFYGQGMNCGFEDCTIMWNFMQQFPEDWRRIFEAYQKDRKPNTDAMQDLSLHNYHVMRDFVADPDFLLQKKLERRIQELYPKKYMPLYSMVSFSHMPYAQAKEIGMKRDAEIKKIIQKHPIKTLFDQGKIDDWIHQYVESIQPKELSYDE